ncbi:unnamed protein product [Prunus armeniaca]|uniref:Uncharacterized protein n=1 Tax=Prunus armeniaca TaxID=36596 RepID=A0A6J5UMM1_PRUAR|nr:unnamed protein product [Prunus armeniaca]
MVLGSFVGCCAKHMGLALDLKSAPFVNARVPNFKMGLFQVDHKGIKMTRKGTPRIFLYRRVVFMHRLGFTEKVVLKDTVLFKGGRGGNHEIVDMDTVPHLCAQRSTKNFALGVWFVQKTLAFACGRGVMMLVKDGGN